MKQKIISALAVIVTIVTTLPAQTNALTISSLSQTQGPVHGGDSLTIKGSEFIKYEDDKIEKIAGSYDHFFALTKNKQVYAWGNNTYGQLGDGTDVARSVPQNVTSIITGETIKDVVCGFGYTMALTESGKVYSWGRNTDGQLGTGDNVNYKTPQDITGGVISGSDTVDKLLAGREFSIALTGSSKVLTWGNNDFGQLGTGDIIDYDTPQNITSQFAGETITDLAASMNHSVLALTTSGKVFSWGRNTYYQVGNGNNIDQLIPLDITSQFGGEVVTSLQAVGNRSFALTQSGKVFAWGMNSQGELGNGGFVHQTIPQDITASFSGEEVAQFALGYNHGVALTKTNKVLTWGYNGDGALGNGNNTNQANRQDITANFSDKIVYLASGEYSSFAVSETGDIYSWGKNDYGQLITGDSTNYNTPQNITANFNLDPISITQIDSIYFGSSKVETFQVIDANTVNLIVPSHTAGFVDVIINDIHSGVTTLANGYEYIDYTIGVPNTGKSY